ncbi:unnamed protein product [Notodromas monacha]|uniref:Retinoid X receptor alpha n=1 Tax=Notodromas monacha TaxID=399045 RepID=A0A7R9BI66_9CRUS|nr:unnamed protein product [Notodromas monacha]CAG0915182.1 unnamed protein product [Notodromas monacha]
MKPDGVGFGVGALGIAMPLSAPEASMPPQSSAAQFVSNRHGAPGFLSQSSAFLKVEGESSQYPPNHPLSGSKHLCAICGDRASGKHYGVHRGSVVYVDSCEGCKGFFKRTVRKELTYSCRESQRCTVDKRQRNRCQYCRYKKCLNMGMRREAVQEERQRTRERDGSGDGENSVEAICEMPIEKILDAEHCADYLDEQKPDIKPETLTELSHSADRQVVQLVEWAKRVPHFCELPIEDQVCLVRAGWNELLIAAFAHRSVNVKNGIILASGLLVERQSAHGAGVEAIFDRVLSELVSKMREMKIDKTELGCLRAIVLFNSGAKGLKSTQRVELLREQVFIALEDYCRKAYSHEPGRFAKLLLRLPSLRSIGLKCLEHLFFYKLIGDTPMDAVLQEMLEAPPVD